MFRDRKTTSPNLSYLICSNPRSGSMFVCDILQQTNIAGYPVEYFNPFPPGMEQREKYLGSTGNADYIRKIIESSTTPNGVFGTKLHGHQIVFFLEKMKAEGSVEVDRILTVREVFEARFPNLHYIWIRRRQRVRQAISMYKALNTGRWLDFTYAAPVYKQIETPNKVFTYDFSKIKDCLVWIEQDDATWEHFFRYNNIEPLVVWYEEFAQDYVGGTQKILSYLGLPTNIEIPPPRTKKQSGAVSEEWERRFKEDLRRVGEY